MLKTRSENHKEFVMKEREAFNNASELMDASYENFIGRMKRDKVFERYKKFKVIRSTELIYVAYKKGLVKLKGKLVLDALLWALKFKGCSISGDEIREIKKIK